MPIKGLTEQVRMPRVGKIHLGIKVKGKGDTTYPKATDYFVLPEGEAPGAELLDELTAKYGAKPKELQIVLPLEDAEAVASQYYRYFTRSRGLICRGDGESCMSVIDTGTGAFPTKDTTDTKLVEMPCGGKECPEYQARNCCERMYLQFMIPDISMLGVWQIDTSSINSIRNINSNLMMLKAVYGRFSMVPLILALVKKEVIPPGGTKKTVMVMDIRHTDSLVQAMVDARKSPFELIAGPIDHEQAERDIAELWGDGESAVMLDEAEEAERMTQAEIDAAKAADSLIEGEEGAEESNEAATSGQPGAEPPPANSKPSEVADLWPGMAFDDLLQYVKAHKKTEGWLFKNVGMTVDEAKADPYKCATTIKQLTDW